ncbi:hypothetical protein GWK47_003785 [Chionoecetes opilio]|uniref:Uncharacterized protein n=1 Tax=Chionoecetes opilio TaxID=41210 RepID=A0A8J5D3K7_CHIOP|nr:hypothetical protein GWK47_003785 [Chionoecetes opilio]
MIRGNGVEEIPQHMAFVVPQAWMRGGGRRLLRSICGSGASKPCSLSRTSKETCHPFCHHLDAFTPLPPLSPWTRSRSAPLALAKSTSSGVSHGCVKEVWGGRGGNPQVWQGKAGGEAAIHAGEIFAQEDCEGFFVEQKTLLTPSTEKKMLQNKNKCLPWHNADNTYSEPSNLLKWGRGCNKARVLESREREQLKVTQGHGDVPPWMSS